MLISTSNDVNNRDFESLITLTTRTLQERSTKENERYLQLLGNRLENEVYDVMCHCAQNTPFEGSIELISGQKFPDIVANKYYGVEVKSTKQNHWRTTGNSILETTRVEDIQRIYMLFGKIHKPIEFKCRPYQECLSDVVVTHSPRYTIDMNLGGGLTIFDKIGIDYDTIRLSDNPIKAFKDYYRNKLNEGEEMWWIDSTEYKPDAIIFKTWNSLPKVEKERCKYAGYAFFPELMGRKQTKFDKFTMWLSVKQRIICPNVRDIFTAGGQVVLHIGEHTLEQVPQVIAGFIDNIEQITDLLTTTQLELLNEYFNLRAESKVHIHKEWKKNVKQSAAMVYDFKDFNFDGWIDKELAKAATRHKKHI